MRLARDLRRSFEHDLERLPGIANGEREQERVAKALQSACKTWRFRGQKGPRPTKARCLRALREQMEEARLLLSTWVESGRNYPKWQARHPELFRRVVNTVSKTEYVLWPGPETEENDEPVLTRRYELEGDWLRSFNTFDVHWLFMDLLRNPLRKDILTCDRCGRWFLNRSGHRNKRFCQRRCAVLTAVTRSVKKRRQLARQEKLKRARAMIRDWTAGKSADWKQWVSERTGLKASFLSRALNRGELKPPAGILGG